jgi:hypothetical protein
MKLRLVSADSVQTAPTEPGIEYHPPPLTRPQRNGVPLPVFRSQGPVDYQAVAMVNADVGRVGELLVLASERDRLTSQGREDLAEQIVHVSLVEGDSAGYDIRSYEVDGTPRYIEVKTTIGGPGSAFFLTSNEIAFSRANPDRYQLIRLYRLDLGLQRASAFVLAGDVSAVTELTPITFRALPRIAP